MGPDECKMDRVRLVDWQRRIDALHECLHGLPGCGSPCSVDFAPIAADARELALQGERDGATFVGRGIPLLGKVLELGGRNGDNLRRRGAFGRFRSHRPVWSAPCACRRHAHGFSVIGAEPRGGLAFV